VGVLVGVLVMAGLWITILRRKVDERSAALNAQIQERQKAEQQRLMAQERARIAHDLHDELGARLTHLCLQLELVAQSRSPGEPDILAQEAIGSAREVIRSLEHIVWAIHPRNDSFQELFDCFTQFAVEFLDRARIPLRLESPDNFPDLECPAEVRHNLFLTLKEALNNVVCHSGAGEVRLQLGIRNGVFQMMIQDNGRGFAHHPDEGLGNGLRNMRERVKQLGGRCDIASRAGKGTRILVVYPIR